MIPSTDPIVGKFIRHGRVRLSSSVQLLVNVTVNMKSGPTLFYDGAFLLYEYGTADLFGFYLLAFVRDLVNQSGQEPLEPDWYDQAASAIAEALPVVAAATGSMGFTVGNTTVPGCWTAGLV